MDESSLTLQVTCSKGTYVRTLGQDLAAALGTYGYIDHLRRLWVEPFHGESMVTIEELQASAADSAGLQRWLLPLDRGIQSWPRVDLDADAARRMLDGQVLEQHAGTQGEGNVRIYGPAGEFLGIAQQDAQGRLAPRRLIANQRDRIVASSC